MSTFEELEEQCKTIKRNYGIELNWYEKIVLRKYLDIDDGFGEFMANNFGIDVLTASYHHMGVIGMGLIGTPEFKQYCQNHVQEWRDERELI